MAISSRLKELLRKSKVTYRTHKHPVAYTAQEIAASLHVSGKHLAKCVLVTTDAQPWLAVLPAAHLVAFPKLKAVLRTTRVRLASEAEIKQAFPDVEVGAMSAFGNLYQVPVVVDKSLTEAKEIVCNAGTHTDTITLRYQDFVRVAKPRVAAFSLPPGGPAKARAAAKRSASRARAASRKRAARRRTTPRRKKTRRRRR